MKISKNILIWLLICIVNFIHLPLQAQENINIEDIDIANQINTSQKEIGQLVIDNDEAKLAEAREILRNQAKKYNIKSGTFRDKVTTLNMSTLPPIGKNESFKNSIFFKQKGSLFRFILEKRLEALDENFLQGGWNKGDYENYAVNTVRQLILVENKDDVLKQITFGSERNAFSDASYLIAYSMQNSEFIDAIDNAKKQAIECRSYGPERDNDPECKEAYELENYDLSLLKKSNKRIRTIAKYTAQQINLCISNVLLPLQAFEIDFEDPKTFLENNPNAIYGLCGVTKNEMIDLILENTITKDEAYDQASEVSNPTKFWNKLLHTLDYITPSYYFKRYETIDNYKSKFLNGGDTYITDDEIYTEALASVYLTDSLNKSIAQKASNLITYGKLFYYNHFTLGSIKDNDGRYQDASDGFAEGWHKTATNKLYYDLPIAKLAQEALINSGKREYQDLELANVRNEVRFLNNAKKESEFLLFTMDFIDPLMAVAPFASVGKGLKVADATTDMSKAVKVVKVADKTESTIETAKNTVKTTAEVLGHGDDVKAINNATNATSDISQAVKKTETATGNVDDVVNDLAKVSKSNNLTSDVTALSPDGLTKKLEGPVDNLVQNNLTDKDLKNLFTQRQKQRFDYAKTNRFPRKYQDLDRNLSSAKSVLIQDGYVRVTKASGTTVRVTIEDFKLWVEGIPDIPGTGISQAERDLIHYDDVVKGQINARQELKANQAIAEATAKEFSKDFVVKYSSQINKINQKMKSFNNSIGQGCSTPEVCKNLLEWISDWRKEFNAIEDELLLAYRKTNPQATIQDLRKMLKNQPDNFIPDIMKLLDGTDTNLANFLQGGPIKIKGIDFNTISASFVDYINFDDAINFLKGTDTSYFEPLKIIAGPEDLASLTNKVRNNLIKRKELFQSHYNLLNTRIQNAMKARNLTPNDKDYKKIYKYITDNWIKDNKKIFPNFRKGDDVLKNWKEILDKIDSVL